MTGKISGCIFALAIVSSYAQTPDAFNEHAQVAKNKKIDTCKTEDKCAPQKCTPCNPCTPPVCPPPCDPCAAWKAQLIDKEGTYEMGVDILIMSSSLTHVFSDETIANQIAPAPPLQIVVNDRSVGAIKPEYNVGFGVDLRYRAPTKNDVGIYYKYLRNNGKRSYQDHTIRVVDVGTNTTSDETQDDKGSLHSHMNILDFMFGRTYVLSEQSVIRVTGGLSYNDFSMTIHFQDNDLAISSSGTSIETLIHSTQKNDFWSLGPKLGMDLEYYFLPRCWRHDYNMYLNSEFGIGYAKDWSKGESQSIALNSATPANNSDTSTRWHNDPRFKFYPNINLDMGMKYAYHTCRDWAFSVNGGYRIFAYWNLPEINRRRVYVGGEDTVGIQGVGNLHDTVLIYAGPYASFSVTY